MAPFPSFDLPKWVEGNADKAKFVLGGSAAPSLSIQDLLSLSTDRSASEKALKFDSLTLSLGHRQGSPELRNTIASLYDASKAITADHVITATGTSGANATVLQTLIHAGDHVICQYPIYPQLLGLPKAIGCDVSLWEMDPDNDWKLDLEQLRKLIRPTTTKMIILNSPNNPTGTHLDAAIQVEILDIAREHNIIVFADEIFRPLFHPIPGSDSTTPPSLIEHSSPSYPRVVVTSSLSKVWGLSGARVGWIITRDPSLLSQFLNTRHYNLQATSSIDEIIATEALSEERGCRPVILSRHLGHARRNLELLEAFVQRNGDVCTWTRPSAGATAFIKFHDLSSGGGQSGKATDDVEFCRQLLESKGVLLSPGSLCFGDDAGERKTHDFKGYVRVHFTLIPEKLKEALELIDEFLEDKRRVGAASS